MSEVIPLQLLSVVTCFIYPSLILQVYSDLEVAFVISEVDAISKALSTTVEVLEGHTAIISQYYYGCLFHELLAFQLADRHAPAEVYSLISPNIFVRFFFRVS